VLLTGRGCGMKRLERALDRKASRSGHADADHQHGDAPAHADRDKRVREAEINSLFNRLRIPRSRNAWTVSRSSHSRSPSTTWGRRYDE
jgi:hypothetical protein